MILLKLTNFSKQEFVYFLTGPILGGKPSDYSQQFFAVTY